MGRDEEGGNKVVWKVLAVLIVAQGIFIPIWWVGGSDAPPESRRPGVVEIQLSEELDRVAPDLTVRTPDGETFRLEDHRGQPVVLHFWGTWCPPCVDELPLLLDAFEGTDAALLTVAIDDDAASLEAFFDGEIPPGVVIAAGDGYRDFGANRLPVTILVDADGRLVRRWTGARSWSSSDVRELLGRAD